MAFGTGVDLLDKRDWTLPKGRQYDDDIWVVVGLMKPQRV
jgi:hypothetical protein